MVFTARYHLARGYCCGSCCRHCPYDLMATKGTTHMRDDVRDTEQ
ncbi:MAG: hypothetical protein H0T92_22160 [Pyrinomonadaceae bacterium]|nr:hypothetical protein [Pyrinomonadaceae bacterium]